MNSLERLGEFRVSCQTQTQDSRNLEVEDLLYFHPLIKSTISLTLSEHVQYGSFLEVPFNNRCPNDHREFADICRSTVDIGYYDYHLMTNIGNNDYFPDSPFKMPFYYIRNIA